MEPAGETSSQPPPGAEHRRPAEVVRLLTASQSSLYAYVCSLLGTSAGAADVLQEANVVLWEKAAEYDPSRPFLPWAYKIAYFQVLAHRKRLSRDKLVFDDEMLGQVAESLARRDEDAGRQLEALDGCVAKLSPRHRELVDARYHQGQAVESIARRLRKAPNAVAAELYRVRKALMDCVRLRLAAEDGP